MKPGRNDPCPCGSGKKYKKCCALKPQNDPSITSQCSQAGRNEDYFDERESLINAFNNLRRYTLDKKPHIKEYYRARKMHGDIVNAMIKYHDDGKFEQRTDTSYVYKDDHKREVYLIESEFDLETRVGAQGFYDMLIYKSAPNMNCITEDFISMRRFRKLEKIEFLHSMLDSRLGLFEITGIDSSEGYAYLKEIFTQDEYKIIDIGLSGDENYGKFYIYTRVITYHDICFGTGLNLIFAQNDAFIINHIKKHRKDYNTNGEALRFSQLYNRYSKLPDKIRVVPHTLN